MLINKKWQSFVRLFNGLAFNILFEFLFLSPSPFPFEKKAEQTRKFAKRMDRAACAEPELTN